MREANKEGPHPDLQTSAQGVYFMTNDVFLEDSALSDL